MGLFNSILTSLGRSATSAVAGKIAGKAIEKSVNQKVDEIKKTAGSFSRTFTFQELPTTLEAFKALPEATLVDMYAVAALSLVALTRYEADRDTAIAMLNYLKGPEELSNLEIQNLNDRFMDGKFYKVNSFFGGATPENNYTPSQPFTVEVSSNAYSFENEGWAVLYLKSGGADNPRPVRLRMKPSTSQWFLVEIQYLGDIRQPVASDKWA
ncbi:MAG: hypothetical protein J6W74_02450 [Bacteroidales bacterium]|nr:hypothetical protein [Bacteroidales bacterium]